MSARPLVSVVIVNYNYERYLAECVESVLAQTYPKVEIIVVDDGSTDSSLAILERYGRRITLVRQANSGVAASRNAGIRKSTGTWVAFLDSDDVWMPDKVEAQAEYFADPSVGMVFCGLEFMDDAGTYLGHTRPQLAGDLLPKLVTFSFSSIGGGSSVVARAEILRNLGGFDEGLSTAADLDMWIRISARHQAAALSSPLVRCRRHAGSMGRNVHRFEWENDRVLAKAFADPECSRVHHLRRRSFGKLYMIVAGSYFHQRDPARAMRYAVKSLVWRPSEIRYLLGFPARVLRRNSVFRSYEKLVGDF